jgi:hypothetical protein
MLRARIALASVFVSALAACGPAASGDSNVATPCDASRGARGGCPESMECLSSTFFGMSQSFCYPTARPRCGGTSCCPSGTRCYGSGFGVVSERSLYCLAPDEAARLCKHPQNHFVCTTQFGMLEPVPYSSSACPDPAGDAAPPPRDATIDVPVAPPMDASVMDVPTPRDVTMDTGRDTGVDTGRDTGVDARRDTGADTGVDTGVDTGIGDVPSPPVDVATCSVTEGAPDCDTLAPCNAATFMASCDDGERLRYCEAAAGSGMATIRVRFCVGADVCRACRGGECMAGFEAVCGNP